MILKYIQAGSSGNDFHAQVNSVQRLEIFKFVEYLKIDSVCIYPYFGCAVTKF